MKKENYRKIWEKHNGPIPKDENGRTYEIHHINGNNSDNRLENLKCVSIKEHFEIHYLQNDYAACLRISLRMEIDQKEKSRLASLSNLKRLKNGTHPFLNKEYRQKLINLHKEKIKNGTHHFLNRKKEWTEKQIETYNKKHNRTEKVIEGWNNFNEKNKNNLKESILKRTMAGSKKGAEKTKGTAWYHKLDGSQLRTYSNDERIEKENWIKGRFNGSEMAKKSAKKYVHKYIGQKRSEEEIKKIKEKKLEKSLELYKKEYIHESINSTNSLTQAVYYYNQKFGLISIPTLKKWKKYYNL